MEKQSIILSFRFTGALQQIEAVNFFSEQFKKWFNKSISELNYTITDKSKSSWKQNTKNLKFTDSNVLKFKELLLENKEKIYIDFELLKGLENIVYKSTDIDFSILYNHTETINSLNIILNTALYRNTDWKGFAKEIVHFLNEQSCNILYGFVLNLDNTKLPVFFVEGIGNENLNKKEQEKLFIWSNNKYQCENKIWDIFWGNIITSKHIENTNILNEIEKIVGKENILPLTSNLTWFNLNEPLTDFDITEYSLSRKELYNCFKSKLIS